ncbi:MAG: hypothetical protein GXY83_21210 [Rhodopirellula sp.]|nr:hypothetical protein [Rhodopirellula sp.]
MTRFLVLVFSLQLIFSQIGLAAEPIRVGTFDVDASPPVGSPLAYDPAKGVETPLSCRGIVLTGAGKPIVLCAVDWIGISNGGQTVFRAGLAEAAGTDPHRVAVHTLHQHDAPRCDFAADALLSPYGLSGAGFDPAFAKDVVRRAAGAVKKAIDEARPVTHLGVGAGVVEKVASNRRILGPDGKVQYTRWTACKDPKVRDFPAGTIDPELKLIALFDGDEPLVALTYYATHPQSYYRTGLANPDFPGLARNARQQQTGVPHIHFTGAAGNIGAGKWNDGSPENRQVLAHRLATGMKQAWENLRKSPLAAEGVAWSVEPVVLPLSEHLDEKALMDVVANKKATASDRYSAAKHLVWLRRCRSGDPIDIACLALNGARILHMPGELLIEYQLAAQKLRPDLFVAMAAYGEYAPGYIGTAETFRQGGYEGSPGASKVAPEVEEVLMGALQKLLGSESR